jgi:trans-aconitate methyltransferase
LRIYRDLRVRSSRVSRAADLGCHAGEAGEAAVQRGAAAEQPPFGDGRAAVRIVDVVARSLS